MFDDLLDGPLVGRGRAELGLGGVQTMECGGYFVLKLMKSVIHSRQDHVTRLRQRGLAVEPDAGFYLSSARACLA